MSSRFIYRLSRVFCRALCRMCFRWRCLGQENIPTSGPLLIVCNHQSHLDPVLLALTCPRQLRPLSRDTLFSGPFGWYIRKLGAIPVSRSSSPLAGIREIMRHLGQGHCMLIFPEGTRSEDGSLGEFKAGFIPIAKKKRPTILPVAVDGTFQAWPKGRRFPRLFSLFSRQGRQRMAVSYGKPIDGNQIEGLSDTELMELVSDRIRQCWQEAHAMAQD